MATSLAGCAAAAAAIPFAVTKSTEASPVSNSEPHPDQAIFDLCVKWETKNAEYQRICRRECTIQDKLLATLPEALVLTDEIPMRKGMVLTQKEGWRIEWLRPIAENRYVDTQYRKSKSGLLSSLVNTRVKSKGGERIAAALIERLEANEKQRSAVLDQIHRSEEKTIKPLKAADRVAGKIGAMRAVTIEGREGKDRNLSSRGLACDANGR